nr:ATP synthase F0 subunit 8 [Coreamachilis coreanus]UAM95672.1 ATP synthase F0 subunit 8 [Coreamachilis songi]
MPQMSPLNWLILFILFSLSYIMFLMFNFFYSTLNKKDKISKFNIHSKFMHWKL